MRTGVLGILVLLCAGSAHAQVEAISFSPLRDATGVPRRPTIELTLNVDLQPMTCKAATIYLEGGAGSMGPRPQFSVACEPRKIRFQAQADLDPMRRYEVVLSVPPGPDGSTFRPIHGWYFTTGTLIVPLGKLEIVSM